MSPTLPLTPKKTLYVSNTPTRATLASKVGARNELFEFRDTFTRVWQGGRAPLQIKLHEGNLREMV